MTRQVIRGEVIQLEIDVFDSLGNRVDSDSIPELQITTPLGDELRNFSSANVFRTQEGRYRFDYTVPELAPIGIWLDTWRTVLNGFTTENQFNFIVLSQSASIEVSGPQIGDDPNVVWTEGEINGINILIHQLRCRLNDLNLKSEVLDEYGNLTLRDCPIFLDEELLCFLKNSLSEFNQTPHFTAFGFDSEVIYERNAHVVVEGAFILAAAARMLIEAGREFSITDNGVNFIPPALSAVLNNELSTFVSAHQERLKQIKWSMKPSPMGFGTFRVLSMAPALSRLRHLRGRRIL
jgi:hypothetical protein